MLDAYDELFKALANDLNIGQEIFFDIGIKNIKYGIKDRIRDNWNNIKSIINGKKGELFIRGYGPKGKKHWLYELFYNELFPHITISMDSTNNTEPSKTIHALTDYSKNVKIENIYRIQNYQVSHLFGRTKNPLLFTAGWNIAYVPKYLDPFTGHETKGKYPTDFRPKFYKKNVDMFKVEIDEYNKLLEEKILLKIDDALKLVEANKKTVNELKPGDFKRFKKSVEDELSPIKMNFK